MQRIARTGSTPVVLVIEDDADHAALVQAAFAYGELPCCLQITGSSEEAIDYLIGNWPYQDRLRHPFPDVLILDLDLPGMDGLDFLCWLNCQGAAWSTTPVVVFTGDDEKTTISRALDLGAREVMTKPPDFTDLVDLVEGVLERWRPRIA